MSPVPDVIPNIDFSLFLSGDEDRISDCVKQIHDACATAGVFRLVNHGIPLQAQQDILEAAKDLFNLPLEQKLAVDKSKNNYNRGYERLYGQTVQSDGIPDLKEGFYISRDLSLDHPQVKRGKFAHGPNVWPEGLDSKFQTTCMDYLSHLITLSEQLMQALALSLNLDREYFKEFCQEPMCFYKMLHYPPQQPDADPRQQGIGAHRDFGVLTLLLQDSVAGLEVLDEENDTWHLVQPVSNTYIVNLGSLMQRWTNNTYNACKHRVINHSGLRRYSIACNFNGNPDYSVSPIDEESTYPPITVEKFLTSIYDNVYRGGVYEGKFSKDEK